MSGLEQKEQWSSRLGFLLAAIGFSVGLGNIWRFPYVVGENGGGAFILIYLACVLLIGLPLLTSELALGRHGRGSAAGSLRNVAVGAGASPKWGWVGGLAIFCIFIIMTYYTVIAGWTFDYFFMAAKGAFQGISGEQSSRMFGELTASPLRLLFWHTVVTVLVVLVLRLGVEGGIERAVKFLMPTLFVSLFIMVIYAFIAGDFSKTVSFLLMPDFSKVTIQTVMVAVGQAFFSIGIGMASLITYGAYLDNKTSLPKSAAIILTADTAVAMLAGFAIFPLVFAYGLSPSGGAGLVFQTLPVAFGQMPGGQIFGAIFFFLLISAAMTSCIAGVQAVVAWAEEHWKLKPNKGSMLAGFAIWVFGFLSILSFNHWSDFYPLSFIPAFEGKTIFDTFDFFAANILLLLGGFLTSIFIGWIVPQRTQLAALGVEEGLFFSFWQLVVKFAAPIALLIILVMGLME
jgi:NSS family neurotransmitter:Na+ symporter